MNKISNKEPKGTRDWLPKEFLYRKYIFDTWRRVCLRYGFEEYLTPIVENANIYRAKSGEDVGGKELLTFTDLGGRELSIRPEMTPSVTRLVTKIYNESPKPIKFFSIANFMRNEKPQRGRNREFWQLNVDIFGSNSIQADLEIIQLSLDLMLELGAPKKSFILGLSSRKLINDVLELAGVNKLKEEDRMYVVRTLDKWKKLNKIAIKERLESVGLNKKEIEVLSSFMSSSSLSSLPSELKDRDSVDEIQAVIDTLDQLGYQGLIQFDPTVIRGFDYYDGLVFEMNDRSEDNNRALFGGGRYNGLAEIFGVKNFPAVGIAPGDETMRLFLETWDLLKQAEKNKPEIYYLPLLSQNLDLEIQKLAQNLRRKGRNVLLGLERQKMNKALDWANKKGISQVIIFGEEEKKKGVYKLKDMLSGKEKEIKI